MKSDLARQNIVNNRYNLFMVVATKIEVQIRQHQFCRSQFRANATGIFGADFFVSDMATTRAHDLMGRRFGRLLVVERAGSTASRMALWSRVHGQALEILPALDGHGVDIVPRRTSGLSKSECVDLTEFVTAWAVEHGVKLSAPQWMEDGR